jgi:acetyltransferase-like isoleucine patch superfamily enzyme
MKVNRNEGVLMSDYSLQQANQWLRQSDHMLASALRTAIHRLRRIEILAPRYLTAPLYNIFKAVRTFASSFMRVLLWTPLFKGRLEACGKHLYLYGGLPHVAGPLRIRAGDNCRISGRTTFNGRSSAARPPELIIGDNVDIGWLCTVSVSGKVCIEDNVRIAARGMLFGYPGHPLDPEARARGLPESDDQVGDIVLEQDVWLATGVTVMPGVRIGRGTVVAAGSVVTRDLPPMVLAGGIPARVIRELPQNTQQGDESHGT